LNPLEQPAVQKFMHFFATQEIQRETEFDVTDFIQMLDVFWVERPFVERAFGGDL